jgi:penicillin-binding protein 1A
MGLPANKAAPAARRPSVLRRLPLEVRLTILAAIYFGPPALLAMAATFVYYTLEIPDPMTLPLRSRAVVHVLARDASPLDAGRAGDAYVPIDLLPKHLVDAVLATEDRRFFKHWGLDGSGMLRAAIADIRAGRLVQGGSTVTQQLAKNLFLDSERTISRKLEEVVLALWLELRLSKLDILELYLNRVYFGGGAYGVETAAQRFFNKSAREVTLGEAAMLAGILKAPSRYSPASNPAVARARAKSVLGAMVDAGYLTAREADAAGDADIAFAAPAHRGQTCFDYAVDTVLEQLFRLIGSPTSELIVETTIDREVQCRAQHLVHDALEKEASEARVGQAGLVLMDTEGGIRAVVGGRDHAESQFNRAFKAKRQPGSAFKTFVYLAALENGITPESTVLDLPILGLGWSPRNSGAGYRGAVTVRNAFAQSMNAATARLHMRIGPYKTAAVARRLGIRSPLREDASLALGTSEVTLLELTSAYAVLARDGATLAPYVIERVRTPDGKVLYQHPVEKGTVVVAPAQVQALNDMLHAVVASGTGRRAALPRHLVAGKTGTSQDFRDAWFVGFTAHLVAGVWVGNDDGRAMNGVMGGGLPAQLWHDVMLFAHAGLAPAPLPGTIAVPNDRDGATSAPAGDLPSELPQLPRERIDAEFVERAIAASAAQDSAPSQR